MRDNKQLAELAQPKSKGNRNEIGLIHFVCGARKWISLSKPLCGMCRSRKGSRNGSGNGDRNRSRTSEAKAIYS